MGKIDMHKFYTIKFYPPFHNDLYTEIFSFLQLHNGFPQQVDHQQKLLSYFLQGPGYNWCIKDGVSIPVCKPH